MKRVLSFLLALTLLLPLPALGAEEAKHYAPTMAEESAQTYEEAMEKLTSYDGSKVLLETELCTVFSYYFATPRGGYAYMCLVYKAGAPLGEGAVISLPLHMNGNFNAATVTPDTLEVSEDGKTLTYAYISPITDTEVYTVDLTTGETTKTITPPTQEQLIDYYLNSEETTLEARLETPDCSVILFWSEALGKQETFAKSYALFLIYRDPEMREPEERVKRLLLPSTIYKDIYYPTDRAPDELFLNEDGSVLTYVYSFEDALYNLGGELLHDAGTYTYTVDTATGELNVTHRAAGAEDAGFSDVSPDDWFAPYVNICVEEGLMQGVGEGRFDPQGVVSLAEAATLAARIHHILKGGDGALPAAPEDYGILKISFENGTTLQFDSTQYRFHPVPMSAVLAAELEGEQLEAMGWLELGEMVNAAIALGDGEPAPCLTYRSRNYADEEKGYLSFRANYEGTEEDKTAFRQIEGKLISVTRPPAGDWFRDTVYYLETAGLSDRVPLYSSDLHMDATRADLIRNLNDVAEELLEPINQISDFPDFTREEYYYSTDSDKVYWKDVILSFYNAGILTGKDELGTFDAEGTLTRAECAAMAARLMEPELRLRFQLPPIRERYSYTLTYLMDDPMKGHTTTYPVLPIITDDGVNNGFLTLDGELIPWIGGQEPISIYAMGDLIWCSFWVDGVEQGGLMDRTGSFVLPLQSRFYYAYPVEGGFVASTEIYSHGVHALLDSQGQVVKELGELSQWEVWELYPRPEFVSPFDIHTWGNYYVDGVKHPVSEDFDWVGALTADGRGFVGKDGKIYCIQFEER